MFFLLLDLLIVFGEYGKTLQTSLPILVQSPSVSFACVAVTLSCLSYTVSACLFLLFLAYGCSLGRRSGGRARGRPTC